MKVGLIKSRTIEKRQGIWTHSFVLRFEIRTPITARLVLFFICFLFFFFCVDGKFFINFVASIILVLEMYLRVYHNITLFCLLSAYRHPSRQTDGCKHFQLSQQKHRQLLTFINTIARLAKTSILEPFVSPLQLSPSVVTNVKRIAFEWALRHRERAILGGVRICRVEPPLVVQGRFIGYDCL